MFSKPHTTQAVLDLLEARCIEPVFVPANHTTMSSPTHFYAGKVEESMANGEEELFIQFSVAMDGE